MVALQTGTMVLVWMWLSMGFGTQGRSELLLDILVFNPYAPANKKSSLSSTYRRHENEKKRAYCQRINEVELSSFTPLVFSLTGGMAREATVFYKRLASMLSEKWDQHYSTTLGWLRVTLGFSLLKSSIQCIRGARSTRYFPAHPPVDVILSECRWSSDLE